MQPGREGVEVTVFVPERFGGRDTPWCGTRQRLRRWSTAARVDIVSAKELEREKSGVQGGDQQ